MKRLSVLVLTTMVFAQPSAPEPGPRLAKEPGPLSKQWALDEIQSQSAWAITRGSHKVVVAVIDTGADLGHPDLQPNLWRNEKEKPGNGKDDDGNGFVDDFHGWNFVSNNHELEDAHGHGTHIAGIIGAADNDIGMTGVAPQVSLMILKYFDPRSPAVDSVANTVAAIDYAVKMGADIINFSAGGPYFCAQEEAAIRRANAKGILVIAAAGNERNNSDEISFYPADYALPNILSVTAVDEKREILPTSNYGVRTVDLAAPGKDIYSTLPGGRYGRLTGTSQATAFATGVAALLMSDPERRWTPERLIDHLVRTGEPEQQLAGKTRQKTRLNSYRALAIRSGDDTLTDSQRITLRQESDFLSE